MPRQNDEFLRALAAARVRYELLDALHSALELSGLTPEDLATKLGIGRSATAKVLANHGDVSPSEVAKFLHAMGFELEIKLVPRDVAWQRRVDEVHEKLQSLDGTTKSRVALLTGLSSDEIDQLGGTEEEKES